MISGKAPFLVITHEILEQASLTLVSVVYLRQTETIPILRITRQILQIEFDRRHSSLQDHALDLALFLSAARRKRLQRASQACAMSARPREHGDARKRRRKTYSSEGR